MSSRKYPSGSEKRKKRKQADVFIETQRGDLDKFFRTNSSTSRNPNELALVIIPMEERPNIDLGDHPSPTPEENVDTDDNIVNDHEPIFNLSPTEGANLDDEPVLTEYIYDLAN